MSAAGRFTVHRARPQRGVVLVIVLWVLVLLTIAASMLVTDSRMEMVHVRERVTAVQLEQAARSGVERAVLELLRNEDQRRWEPGARWHDFKIGEIKVQVMIASEHGRVDLNRAERPQLVAALAAAGAGPDEAQRLAAAMVAWRGGGADAPGIGSMGSAVAGPDSMESAAPDGDPTRDNPAGDDSYLAAGKSYLPSRRDFRRVTQLNRLIGLPQPLYERLRAFVTLHGGRRVVPRFAPRALRRALEETPGVGPLEAGMSATDAGAGGNRFVPSPYAIRSRARAPDGSTILVEAVIKLSGMNQQRPYTVYTWRHGREVGLEYQWPKQP